MSIDKVLIVDDDPIVHAIAEAYFSDRGATAICSAMNGHEALHLLRERSAEIDLVLSDLNMPQLDGLEFLRGLKDCGYCGLLVIVSGEEQPILKLARTLAIAHDLRLIGTLAKPFNVVELDSVIQEEEPDRAASPCGTAPSVAPDDLRSAMMRGDVGPFYQPKISVETRRVTGVEALARWHHPDLGLIGPDVFVPMAEQFDLAHDLAVCIAKRAIEDRLAWQRLGVDTRVSINLSPHMLDCLEFPKRLAEAIDRASLTQPRFVFEITESKLLEAAVTPLEVMARLRLMGHELSIDDFGTGYSNIEALREFPFSELKIDRSFVQRAADDAFARACVASSIELARSLDLRVVAEGVETKADWTTVVNAGVDEVQGYLFAKPMPSGAFAEWCCNSVAQAMSA